MLEALGALEQLLEGLADIGLEDVLRKGEGLEAFGAVDDWDRAFAFKLVF